MKGWFKVPGIRPDGDRSIEEQLQGLQKGLAEAGGKTVLDLGCAEGAIGLQFAKAGATRVLGLELLEEHLVVARKLCAGWESVMRFRRASLQEYQQQHPQPEQYDIVLALGIVHKMHDPAGFLGWVAQCTRSLLVFRGPAKHTPVGKDYEIKSKHTKASVNVPAVMRSLGFVDEGTYDSTRGERVQYWRRKV